MALFRAKPRLQHPVPDATEPIPPHGCRALRRDYRTFLSGQAFVVPRTYRRFNGPSLPGAAEWLVGRATTPAYQGPSLIHDHLYDTPSARPAGQAGTRRSVDRIFRAMLTDNDVSLGTRTLIFLGVRAAGFLFWQEAGEADAVVPDCARRRWTGREDADAERFA